MYEVYTKYCAENDLSAETIKMFGTKFPFYVSYVNDGLITQLTKTGKADRVRGWRNVVVKKTEEELSGEEKAEIEFNDYGQQTTNF